MTSEALEIERHGAHITEQAASESDGYLIHGVAIGEGDVTVGQSGIRKRWPKETLEAAAESLEGRPLIVDHENTSRNVVGKVVSTGYKEGVGVLYEAELYDEELAEKIANELLEVSIRGYHEDPDEMEEDETGAKIVENLKFDNLSIVPVGAAPSNTVEVGGSEEISAAECAEMFVEELGATHTPEWSGTERDSWEAPAMEDFETDDLMEISKHFLYTETSFPPENYGDLKFPVVSPDGNLNLAALRAAKNRASQADIPADEIQEIKKLATRLATEHFEDVDFSEESETATSDDDTDEAAETGQSSVADSEDDSTTNMTEENTEENEELSKLRSEVEDLRDEKEDLSTEMEELEAENEELREEIETVRELYAESLSEASPFSAEELTDKFTVEELSTKFDEMDTVELAPSPDPVPQGGDASSEELSTSEEAEERQEKIAELEEQAEKYEELGMMGAAEKSRDKVSELRAE